MGTIAPSGPTGPGPTAEDEIAEAFSHGDPAPVAAPDERTGPPPQPGRTPEPTAGTTEPATSSPVQPDPGPVPVETSAPAAEPPVAEPPVAEPPVAEPPEPARETADEASHAGSAHVGAADEQAAHEASHGEPLPVPPEPDPALPDPVPAASVEPPADVPAEPPAAALEGPTAEEERRRRWDDLVSAALADASAAEAAAPPDPPRPVPPLPPRHRAPDTGAAPAVSAPRPTPGPPRPAPQPTTARPTAARQTAPEPTAPEPTRRRASRAAEPAAAGDASGAAAVVTANYGRLRRRIVLAAVVLVVLVAGGLTAAVVTSRGGTTTAAVPGAKLPRIGDPAPVLAALSASAPVPDAGRLSAQLTPLLASSALGQGVGAEVVDVAGGTVLLDKNAATPVTPASTAKLLTSVAALTALDPESTLSTTVVAGATPGEVVLVGGGDPTLSRAATSANYPGAASLVDLAGQVKTALGGTPLTRVVVDGSLYSGPLTGPGWQAGDAPSSYAAPVTALSVDGGRTSATSANRSGSPATDAGQALAAALGVPRAQVVQGKAAAGARSLGVVHSAPISRIVEQALSQSDNMLAEALARQVALARHQPASFDGAAQAVVAALKEAGVDVAGVTLVDGSGLSPDDQVPPRVLADLIAGAAKGKLARASAILSGLSVAGYDGTLADRGDNDPGTAPGAVRGKTGTLLGVHALAGTVVTADGRLLAFAVVADATAGGDSSAETALDKVAAALAACGCR